MNRIRTLAGILNRGPGTRLLLALCGVLLSMPALALVNTLDRIEPVRGGEAPAVRIYFNRPLQYINHAPENRGDEIQIQLRPVLKADETIDDLATQDSLSWSPTRELPLLDVDLELLGPIRARLSVRFRHAVDFEVQPTADARSLIVTVIPDETTQPAAPTPDPAVRAPKAAPSISKPPSFDPRLRFVVNLESTLTQPALPAPGELPPLEGRVVYVTRFTVDGRQWNRLRVGFFPSREAAEQYQRRLQGRFSRAWVAVASPTEIAQARSGAEPVRPEPPKGPRRLVESAPPPAIRADRPPLSEGRADALMEEARQAMAKGDYRRAVQIYTKLLQHPGHAYHQEALEYLGLARERKGQLAHAKTEYERYLAAYPEGEGADRVRQRLAGLTTARAQPREKLPGSRRKRPDYPWQVFGGFSQYYRRDISVTDIEGSEVDQSTLSNDLDVTARRRGETWDVESRLTGGYEYDFLDDGGRRGSRVSSLYLDLGHRTSQTAGRLGRQTRSTGGVLGRFDGGLLSHQALPWARLNLVTGYPVNSARDALNTDRYFYGLSTDLGTFGDAWDFVAFVIEQRNGDLIDRRAVGGEVRYFDPNRSLLTSVDYDIYYDELNTFLLLGNWTLANRLTVNATLDYRKTPVLTTNNALQGQPVDDMDDLQDLFSDREIRELAEDRTARSRTVTLGLSKPLTDRYQLSGDVTVTDLSSTPTSGGVEGTPSTGREYFYNAQLIGSSLFKPGDISILSLRYADASSAETLSAGLNSRYPITQAWRINPRGRVDYRQNSNDDSTQWTLTSSLRSEYRWRKRTRFELEVGGEWSTQEFSEDNDERSAYFVDLGYRVDF